jgi:poly(3-hydroxybutyrate) depolymerase
MLTGKNLIFIAFLCSVFSSEAQIPLVRANDPYIIDSSHYSTTFGEIRNYRIFLPPAYYLNREKRYPVIYFFHGWSQRYFGPVGDNYSNYDKGEDNNGDNIANYVATHDVIVVKPDGFNPVSDEQYNLTPYNEGSVTTFRQFPVYFPELVSYIDASYNTIADRGHRAVTGLSMGGFMSFWVGGKYPHLLSAVGNFCGSQEFMVGPSKFPVEYRNHDMFNNYAGLNVRFHYGDKDNLRYYHQDLNRIWPYVMDNYEYRIYDAFHTTCGMGEMFDFCMNTFKNPPVGPDKWDHIDVYPDFSVWDYHVSSNRPVPGFTVLEEVTKDGFRCAVREFLPDGELMPFVSLSVTTPPLYEKNRIYTICDVDPVSERTGRKTIRSDNSGRLKINLNGGLHEIGISSKKEISNLCIASVEIKNMNWAKTNKEVAVSVKILNKGFADAWNVKAVLSSTRDHVDILNSEAEFGTIGINKIVIGQVPFTFYVKTDSIEMTRLKLVIRDGNNHEWTEFFELPLRKDLPALENVVVADGKIFTVARAGIYDETVLLGRGNGDGIANPGESIVILANDHDRYYRTSLISNNKFVNPHGINKRESDSWQDYDHIGGSAKYSIPVISSRCPENQVIEFFAEYWLPERKSHIIKQGLVNIRVTGVDRTSPKVDFIQINGNNVLQVKLHDGAEIKSVKARLIPVKDVKGLDDVNLKDPNTSIELVLNDSGLEGDTTPGDWIFSKRISTSFCYFYRVQIEAMDSFGNCADKAGSEVFIVYSD